MSSPLSFLHWHGWTRAGKYLASISKFVEAATANFCTQPKSIFSSNVACLVPFHWQGNKNFVGRPQEVESGLGGFSTSVFHLGRNQRACIMQDTQERYQVGWWGLLRLREEKTFSRRSAVSWRGKSKPSCVNSAVQVGYPYVVHPYRGCRVGKRPFH